MSKRKAAYVIGDQKKYYLDYHLVYHDINSDRTGEGYYGTVVEQYLITSPKTGKRIPDRVSDRIIPYAGVCMTKERFRQGMEPLDRCEIAGLSEDKEEAEAFLNMVADEQVTPVSLCEVYDDWMSAFHPRWDRAR